MNYVLKSKSLPKSEVTTPKAIDHIVVIDVSGSMYNDLPQLREHLKNRIPSLIAEIDTISIVWFSGKGSFGVLQEAVAINDLKALNNLYTAIDRFLVPQGLTGFKEPLEEVSLMIDRLHSKRESLINLIFMTDGQDNQWSHKDIIKSVDALSEKVNAASFIEYGWYCNHDLLNKMAEEIGGQVLFSERFNDYQLSFEGEFSKDIAGNKIILDIDDALLDIAFSYTPDGSITTYSIKNGKVLVNNDLENVYYFGIVKDYVARISPKETQYAALSVLTKFKRFDMVEHLLARMGDIYLIDKYYNSFTKQDYIKFQDYCSLCITNPSYCNVNGIDFDYKPNPNPYTVLDLLNDISSDNDNLMFPFDMMKSYSRTSAKRESLTDLKFVNLDENRGLSLDGISYNESRANVGIRFRYNGSIELPESILKEHRILPPTIISHKYTTLTLVLDGIIHTKELIVSLSEETIRKIKESSKLNIQDLPNQNQTIDISELPIINRTMAQTSVSSTGFIQDEFAMQELLALNKVLKFYKDQHFGKTSVGLATMYNDDAAKALKELGITDGGFSPSTRGGESTDYYVTREVQVKIKGLSALPSVNAVLGKIAKGSKLNLADTVMNNAIKVYNDFMAMNPCNLLLENFFTTELIKNNKSIRELRSYLTNLKFAMIVGGAWFSDIEEADLVTVTSEDLVATIGLVDVEVKI